MTDVPNQPDSHEEARLEVLGKYRILDTPQESEFQDLVKLAAQICDTPISLVSLVDRDRQWFKGRVGLEASETPRRLSFCSHAIRNAPETMEIPDATADPRFARNDLVTGDLHLRFYAGAPLVTPEGHALGTLCVIDTKPRHLTPAQKEALRILSNQVMAQLELRRRLAELEVSSQQLAASHAREADRHESIERHQARELRNSEERFRAIFEHAGLGIGELDATGRFLVINERWCEIVKRSASELLGMTVHDLTHPDDRETTARLNQELVRGDVPWVSYEKRYSVGGDSGFVWVHVTVSAIRGDGGEFLRAIVMVEDITERKRFQSELERSVTERTASLRQAMAELEAFSYSLSHDLRAPLRAIKSFSSFALEANRARLDAESVADLERVLKATDRMDQLISDVLAFIRVSRQEIKMKPVDVQAVLLGLIQERPELRPPRSVVEIASALEPVLGHEALLTQCFANLLENAVKFVSPGVTPHIRISSENGGPWVHLVFADNGIGFNPEANGKIFQMFTRLHSQSEYEGTGIGLAIVKRAVERMGGRVGAESAPGQGSRFWLQLRRPDSSEPVAYGEA